MGAWRWALSAAVAALFLLPVGWLVVASFKPAHAIFAQGLGLLSWEEWTFANYPNAFRRAGLASAMTLSLLQVLAIAAAGLLVNSLAAFAFARFSFPGRELLFSAVVALIILPVEVLAVPMFLTARDLGLTGEPAAAFLGLTLPFVAKAFNIYFLRQQFMLWPKELEEAAILDGAGVWRLFRSVALPAQRPALVTLALLDVLFHWSDFLWPLLISSRESTRTVQIGLSNLFTEPPLDWGAILACAVLATLPVLVAFRVFQRHLVLADPRVGLK